jgi:predicted NBD/HSP70 family sugar kinase
MENMYYIGLDVHKKTISYCVKDGSGRIYAEAEIPATRLHLEAQHVSFARWLKRGRNRCCLHFIQAI